MISAIIVSLFDSAQEGDSEPIGPLKSSLSTSASSWSLRSENRLAKVQQGHQGSQHSIKHTVQIKVLLRSSTYMHSDGQLTLYTYVVFNRQNSLPIIQNFIRE